MKAIKAIVAITLMASVLAMSVFAAEFIPSRENDDGPQIVDGTQEEPNVEIVFPKDHDIEPDLNLPDEQIDQIQDKLEDIKEELENTPIEDLLDEFEDLWEEITDGAPLENAIIHDLFEVVPLIDGKIEFSFTVDGIGPDDPFIIIYRPVGSDEWMILDYVIDENGVITVTLDGQATIVIITDSGKKPVVAPDAPQSPQTGVQEGWNVAAFCGVVILSGAAVVLAKKLRKMTVQ